MVPKGRRADQSTPPPAPPLRTPLSQRQSVVVFAHGAGAPSSSDWMIYVVTDISGGKRRPPPKADKLVDHHLGVVKKALAKHPGHSLVLMGRSMGSRVSCMLASSDDIDVSAIVCLGYPLKGNKDSLCPLDKLEFTCKKMTCKNELHVVNGGDHSFKIGKRYKESARVNQHDAEMEAVKEIAQFVQNSITES